MRGCVFSLIGQSFMKAVCGGCGPWACQTRLCQICVTICGLLVYIMSRVEGSRLET